MQITTFETLLRHLFRKTSGLDVIALRLAGDDYLRPLRYLQMVCLRGQRSAPPAARDLARGTVSNARRSGAQLCPGRGGKYHPAGPDSRSFPACGGRCRGADGHGHRPRHPESAAATGAH